LESILERELLVILAVVLAWISGLLAGFVLSRKSSPNAVTVYGQATSKAVRYSLVDSRSRAQLKHKDKICQALR
jgi:uncharacterized protein YneF (UPF0154 family)